MRDLSRLAYILCDYITNPKAMLLFSVIVFGQDILRATKNKPKNVYTFRISLQSTFRS